MRRVEAALLLLAAALKVNNKYYIHAEPTNKVFRKMAGYRLTAVTIFASSAIG